MNEKKMENLISELQTTEYWPAVVKYLLQRHEYAQSVLFTAEPSKEPDKISHAQGICAGLSDLIGYVYLLKQKSKKKQKEEETIEE
ncbi:MAG: hypothetical protein WC346_10025 [Methanogenium sp.]